MKKIVSILVLAATFTGCNAQKKPIMTSEVTTVQTRDMLVGKYDKKALLKSPYNLWFNPNYENYKPSAATLSELKKHTEGVTVTVFMGTWCEDSQHRVPEFYNVLDAIGFDTEKVTLIMVDKSKTTPENFEAGLDITNVPTFIFYKNGKELHRIVESYMESAEKDMLKILSGQPYKHAYQD
ncbi:thioredoxin family protein [Flavobacterium suncheonense]|uniref:thioredoxin family protein n=1 Tax=Flavobacterium suncheonense TaxID=350894 RepID=UPI003FA374FA